MIERDGPQQGSDMVKTEPAVFDFRDPNLQFETGIRINGMETWKDVTKVFAKLTNSIGRDAETNKDTPVHIIRHPNFVEQIKKRDMAYGFHGQSTGFGIEIIPTDLSFVKPVRKTKPDSDLARTFVLSRHIQSSALPKDGAIVLTACTVSLVDRGVFSYENNYGDGLDFKHYFGASVSLKPVDELALRRINDSKGTPASVATARQNPISKKRGRF